MTGDFGSPMVREPAIDSAGLIPEWIGSRGILEDPGEGWLRTVFRFSRPDGSTILGPLGRDPDRLVRLGLEAIREDDAGLATVLEWWKPGSARPSGAAPPLPTRTWDGQPLAILRPNWVPKGEWLAIHHPPGGSETRVELAARGVVWLASGWSGMGEGVASEPKVTFRSSGGFADVFEWTYKVGATRVTRSAILLRGRGLAILGHEEEGPTPPTAVRIALADGVEARVDPDSRMVVLSSGRGKPTARLLAPGHPGPSGPIDLGSLAVEGREVVVRPAPEGGRRRWAPLLVSWEKPPKDWRLLSVTSRSSPVPTDKAFAAWVGWGSGSEGLLIYRSLGPADLRVFLGHQTKAKFLVGSFGPNGEVRPLVKIED